MNFFRRLFKHKLKTLKIVVSETIRVQTGLQLGVFGQTPNGGQKVGARRSDWFENQDSVEIDTATRFSKFVENGLTEFKKVPSKDDVDVVGKSADGSKVEEFQVTRLWNPEFWKNLNTQGASDGEVSKEQMRDLVLQALERKGNKYSPERRKLLNLLIDTNPVPVLPHLVEYIKEQLAERLHELGFKSVWLIAVEEQHTYRID